MHWMDWTGGGIVMMIFWWLIFIGAIVFVVKWASNQKSGSPEEDSALEMLKKRYVRGEISKEEFENKKRDIL
ncbi:MAG: SHOCT domain-containing protein [Bacteroidota bacterium]|nr:SHOCT domain-containing protein [Bacteroidota bacterium]